MKSWPLSNAFRSAATVAALLALALGHAAQAQIKSGDDPEGSEIWKKVRASLFESRPIANAADGQLVLEAPLRAEDAAIVPIAIKTRFPQTAAQYVDKLYLVIDNNPSPISAIFHFTPASGSADIETRVRVDEYTHVRAIAELNDGRLFMTTRWVKASGGCSAPPGKDPQAALATLGKMRFRIETPEAGSGTGTSPGSGASSGDRPAQPVLAQLMISHPNNSGLAMDQVSRQFTPAHFVRKVNVSYAGQPVMSADVDFSISENPNFRFYFLPTGDGELRADVTDSNDLHFESAVKFQSRP